MKSPADLARRYLDLANRDIKAFEALAAAKGVDDVSVGFHAQQAAEKCLKAVPVRHGVEFRKTHDLAELLDLLADHKKPSPPHAELLDELNPYAVEFRYGWVEPRGLDRAGTRKLLADLRDWAKEQIS